MIQNILFIAFEFPPLNRGGVFRSLAFVKYLRQFDINPIVISLDRASYNNVFDVYTCDDNLGKDVINNSTILYAKASKSKELNKIEQFTKIYFSIHGIETKNWESDFHDVAAKAVKNYNVKAIFATVPPFSILPLALDVSKKYNIPLIYDFRDAWSQWKLAPYGTRLHYWINLLYERKYFKYAKAVIATSEETLSDFIKFHKTVDKNKFYYIPNGYNGELDSWEAPSLNKDEIIIGYVGSFYYTHEARAQMMKPWWKKRGHRMLQYIPQKQDWLYRSPYFFFKALRVLKDKFPYIFSKIKVKFVGKKQDWLVEMIKEFGITNNVELLGEMPHAAAIEFQKECDMLLITSAKRIGGKDYSIAGKTFEYIQSQKPILAFVCEGAQKDILSNSGMAVICNPDDTEESVQKLNNYINGNILLEPDYNFIKTLSREYQTSLLSTIISTVIREN